MSNKRSAQDEPIGNCQNPTNADRLAKEARARYLTKLSRLLTGGLFVTPRDGTPEQALLRVAAAQLKAILISMNSSQVDKGPEGWLIDDDQMSPADTSAALSGVVAMLQGAPDAIEQLTEAGDFQFSYEDAEEVSK